MILELFPVLTAGPERFDPCVAFPSVIMSVLLIVFSECSSSIDLGCSECALVVSVALMLCLWFVFGSSLMCLWCVFGSPLVVLYSRFDCVGLVVVYGLQKVCVCIM